MASLPIQPGHGFAYPFPTRDQIAAAIETLVAVLDIYDGDPDREGGDPPEDDGSAEAAAWLEWDTLRPRRLSEHALITGHEDAEEDDDDSCDAGDDNLTDWGPNSGQLEGGWFPTRKMSGAELTRDNEDAEVSEIDEDDDPAESDGDDKDFSQAEDDFVSYRAEGPGCPIADPCGSGDEDLEQEHHQVPIYGVDQTKGPWTGNRFAVADQPFLTTMSV